MNLNFLPNLITLFRVALLPPLAYYLINKNYPVALVLFMFAGASDALDGFLAKHFKWTSRFGAIADPLADKLLMLVSYGYLALEGYLPLWLLAIVVGRDIYIVTAAYVFYRVFGPFELKPSWLSKTNTAFQIFLVTWVMFSLVFTNIPVMVTYILMVLVTLTSIGSGVQYSWFAFRETRLKLRQRREHQQEKKSADQ